LRSIVLTLKVRFNWWLDRLIEWCDRILAGARPAPRPLKAPQVLWLGNLAWMIRQWPRENAWLWQDAHLRVIFMGSEQSRKEIPALFFDTPVEAQPLGRFGIGRLQQQVDAWLEHDADLVICELSPFQKNIPETEVSFSSPSWVDQEVFLPPSMENFLSGNAMKRIRKIIHRAETHTFGQQITRRAEDFDFFYHRMYVPYVQSRHQDKAEIPSLEQMKKTWFEPGQLFFLTQDRQPVAGTLAILRDGVCSAVALGVLDADPQWLEKMVTAASDWQVIQWAHAHGARRYDLGGSRPWKTNGIFLYKSHWRPVVCPRKRIVGTWHFCMRQPSPLLKERINARGFISQFRKQPEDFYLVVLEGDMIETVSEQPDIQHLGLAGIAVISPKNLRLIKQDKEFRS
jgi:hypothetical protein